MTKEYRYRPPFKYLLVGIGGLIVSMIFALAIGKDQIWFSIVVALFSLATLAMGIGFLTIFIRKFNVGNLKLGDDYIEIPGRWKERVCINFNEILDMGEFDTYDNVIEIQSKKGLHLIEKNWMKKKEFDNVKHQLQEYWRSK